VRLAHLARLACLLAGLVAFPLWAAPTVLVVASYHPGFAWSDAQLTGFRETLARRRPDLSVRVDYLDAKHVVPSDESRRAFVALLSEKYRDAPPQLLVAQDDDALDFLLALRRPGALFAGLPLVFSGVSGARAEELAATGGVTGVFDDADIAANVELLRRLRPGLRTVYFIHDQSRSGRVQADNVRQWRPRFPDLEFAFLTDLPIAGIQQRLRQLGPTEAAIALTFNRDADNRVIDHREAAVAWGEAARAPVLVKEEEMLAPGILGGIVLSGRREGTAAAALALRILGGSAPATLPMQNGTTRPVFQLEALHRFDIDERQLPADAEIVGREPPLRVTHPVEFWVTITLFAAASVVIALLVLLGARERRAKRQALAGERNYREIFNASNEAVIIHATDGRVIDVNDRFHSMFGYAEDAPLPASADAFASDDERFSPAMAAARIRACREEGPQLFEWRARRADDSVFWAEVALKQAQIGDQTRIIAAVRDVSARKAAEAALQRSEARYDLLLRHTPVGIMHLSTDWTLSYCNKRFTEIIGAPQSSILGQDMRKLRDPSIQPALARALAGEASAYQGEYTATASDRRFWLDLRAAPVRDESEHVVGCIVFIDDISERVAAERTLREFNESLEKGIAERTAELSKTNAELKAATRQLAESEKMAALGTLVAGVAHELNTPIGNARMLATTLADLVRDIEHDIESNQVRRSSLLRFLASSREAAETLDRNLERAGSMIGSFKQVAVDQTSMGRRRFNLAAVIDDTVALVRRRIDHAGCQVAVDNDTAIDMDSYPGAVEQVLINLIMNSLTHAFTENVADRRITISTKRLPGDGGIALDYRDNGAGMAPETLNRVFEPFFTTAFGHGGSGLGLYIVYNQVTAVLGGTIEVSSDLGTGTAFALQLPVTAPAS